MKLFMLAFVLTGLAAASAEADPLDVFGQWRTDDGDAVIAISTCGEGAPCGTVVWINPQTVEINADRNNRDPALPCANAPSWALRCCGTSVAMTRAGRQAASTIRIQDAAIAPPSDGSTHPSSK